MDTSMVRKGTLFFFLPVAIIASLAVILSAFFLSAFFIEQFTGILQAQEAERIQSALHLFSQIHFRSIPLFLSTAEERSIQDFLFGRGDPRERALRALEVIDRVVMANELIDSIYLYSSVSGILSTRAGLEKGDSSDPDLLPFLDRLERNGAPLYFVRRTRLQGDEEYRNYITLAIRVLPHMKDSIRCALVANLSERKIRSVLSPSPYYSSLYILAPERIFLSHPQAEMFSTPVEEDERFIQILGFTESVGTKTIVDKKGNRWIATWAEHPELRWLFVTLAPEEKVFALIYRIRNRVIITALLLLALVLAVAYLTSLRLNKRLHRKQVILDFLREKVEEEQKAESYFARWNTPYSLALLVLDREKGESILSTQFSLIEEALEKRLQVTGVYADVLELTERTCIVLLESRGRTLETLETVIKEIYSKFRQVLGGYVFTNSFPVKDLPHAYRTLIEKYKIDYLRKRGELVSITMENAKGESDKKSLSFSSEKTIFNLDLRSLEKALHLKNSMEVQQAFENLLKQLWVGKDPDFFRYTVSVLFRLIPELLQEEAELLLPGGVEGFRSRMSGLEHLEDLATILREVAKQLQEQGSLHGERRKQELLKKVKAIVETRLRDKTLSTAIIASEVGLSVGYLRDLFKSVEGISLLEYLGNKRLERAKQLLKETDMPIREVCNSAGFLNYSYFITYFKKYTGITPKEYRDKFRL
ncbi:MAG: AraC family transcriptional regulator [Spirochaetales bacterium]